MFVRLFDFLSTTQYELHVYVESVKIVGICDCLRNSDKQQVVLFVRSYWGL